MLPPIMVFSISATKLQRPITRTKPLGDSVIFVSVSVGHLNAERENTGPHYPRICGKAAQA
jgi:hypothetical protein